MGGLFRLKEKPFPSSEKHTFKMKFSFWPTHRKPKRLPIIWGNYAMASDSLVFLRLAITRVRWNVEKQFTNSVSFPPHNVSVCLFWVYFQVFWKNLIHLLWQVEILIYKTIFIDFRKIRQNNMHSNWKCVWVH